MNDDLHIDSPRSGQAPPLAGALVVFALLGLGIGLVWWPAWLLVAVVLGWAVWER